MILDPKEWLNSKSIIDMRNWKNHDKKRTMGHIDESVTINDNIVTIKLSYGDIIEEQIIDINSDEIAGTSFMDEDKKRKFIWWVVDQVEFFKKFNEVHYKIIATQLI